MLICMFLSLWRTTCQHPLPRWDYNLSHLLITLQQCVEVFFFWQQWVDTNWSSRPGAFHERSCNVWWIFLGPAPYLNLSTNHQEHLSSACFSFHNILIQFKLIQHFSFQIRQHQHAGWISGFWQLLQTSWWRKDWILIFANTLRVSWCKIHSQAR